MTISIQRSVKAVLLTTLAAGAIFPAAAKGARCNMGATQHQQGEWRFRNIQRTGEAFKPVQERLCRNDFVTSQKCSLRVTKSESVGMSVNAEVGGGIQLVIVSASAKMGLTVQKTIQTTTGFTVSQKVPPKRAMLIQYGVVRLRITGELACVNDQGLTLDSRQIDVKIPSVETFITTKARLESSELHAAGRSTTFQGSFDSDSE